MRRLSLGRHAKSSWGDNKLADFDRPLNKRGLRDAPRMASRLAQLEAKAQMLISSPAMRARATAAYYVESLELDAPAVQLDPRIYEAGTQTLMNLLAELDDSTQHVMLVGHNPGISDLALELADCPFSDMPTGAIVVIELHIARWCDLAQNCGHVSDYLYPKDGDD